MQTNKNQKYNKKVSKTYANALFELSLEENIADEVLCQSKEIKDFINKNYDGAVVPADVDTAADSSADSSAE